MPTYIFNKDAFLTFIGKHFKEEDSVVVVSSDFADSEIKEIESHVGLKDYYEIKANVSADIFKERDAEEFDCLFKYITVFSKKDDLTDNAIKNVRKQ